MKLLIPLFLLTQTISMLASTVLHYTKEKTKIIHKITIFLTLILIVGIFIKTNSYPEVSWIRKKLNLLIPVRDVYAGVLLLLGVLFPLYAKITQEKTLS